MEIITVEMTELIKQFRNGKVDLKKYEFLIKRKIEKGINEVVQVGKKGESDKF